MQWNRITRTENPTTTVLKLTEVKAHLNITHDDEDSYLNGLIATATAMVDGPAGIGIALLTQTYRASADGLSTVFEIPLTPVQNVVSITYLDTAGDAQQVEDFRVDTDAKPARVYLKAPVTNALAGSVKVTFTSGFGDVPADVPQDLRHALLMLVTMLYDHRNGLAPSIEELPFGVRSIFGRYGVPV